MKKRVIFITLPVLLVLALMASPVLAKDPEPPEKGLLWEAIASLQEQIETGLAALAQQLSEGLAELQGQIDAIQGYLADVSALETQVGENILTEGEDISLLNNDAGYLTSIPSNFMEEGENVSLLNNDAGYLTSIPSNFMEEGENVSLLNNDAGYITEALQVENIVQVLKQENVVANDGDQDVIRFEYNLPAGAVPISANGELWLYRVRPDGKYPGYVLQDADHYRIFPSFYQSGEVIFNCWYFAEHPWVRHVQFRLYYSYISD